MAIVFVCGSDMEPGAIRARNGFGRARFTGIGSIAAGDFPEFPTDGDRIWGLVIEWVEIEVADEIDIVRRDGSSVRGVVGTSATDVSDLAAVVAQARYWELPVSWVRSLDERQR